MPIAKDKKKRVLITTQAEDKLFRNRHVALELLRENTADKAAGIKKPNQV